MARPPVVAAYGLHRPDLEEIRAALHRVSPRSADTVWPQLLEAAGVDGSHGQDADAVERLVNAMRASTDPVIALCGRAMAIRLSAYEHLATTAQIVRNAR